MFKAQGLGHTHVCTCVSPSSSEPRFRGSGQRFGRCKSSNQPASKLAGYCRPNRELNWDEGLPERGTRQACGNGTSRNFAISQSRREPPLRKARGQTRVAGTSSAWGTCHTSTPLTAIARPYPADRPCSHCKHPTRFAGGKAPRSLTRRLVGMPFLIAGSL